MKKIYWVLINYNSNDDINKIISNNKYKDVKFIIIDNSFNFVNTSNVEVITPNTNLGYIGGFQLALKNIDYHLDDIIIFSNSDIETLFDVSKLKKLEYGKCYIPDVTTINGKKQNPHLINRPSIFKFIAFYLLTLNHNIFNVYRKFSEFISTYKKSNKLKIKNELKVYAGHGSIYIFKTNYILKLKDNSYNFLFGEEIHIAEHLKLYNIDIVYKKELKILHYEHSSTSKIGKIITKYYNESYISILKNYYLNAPNYSRS